MKKLCITAWILSALSFIWLTILSVLKPNLFSFSWQHDALVMVLSISLLAAFIITSEMLNKERA